MQVAVDALDSLTSRLARVHISPFGLALVLLVLGLVDALAAIHIEMVIFWGIHQHLQLVRWISRLAIQRNLVGIEVFPLRDLCIAVLVLDLVVFLDILFAFRYDTFQIIGLAADDLFTDLIFLALGCFAVL